MSLERTYEFKNSKKTWTGVPIMAANMDTVGTFEMAEAFASEKMFTCMHKHYDVEVQYYVSQLIMSKKYF